MIYFRSAHNYPLAAQAVYLIRGLPSLAWASYFFLHSVLGNYILLDFTVDLLKMMGEFQFGYTM